VGNPPPIEVTITNVNDNIDRHFLLNNVVSKFGSVDECEVYFHPKTKKHLGIARVVFGSTAAASACVENMNDKPVMGKNLHVFKDPFGE
jgi:histone-lysine N-methyltransferase SETD1